MVIAPAMNYRRLKSGRLGPVKPPAPMTLTSMIFGIGPTDPTKYSVDSVRTNERDHQARRHNPEICLKK